jgi:hypothetical protein
VSLVETGESQLLSLLIGGLVVGRASKGTEYVGVSCYIFVILAWLRLH